MSTDRTAQLTPQENALKLATREAVEAAGGQDFVAREVGRSQGRISDYCSSATPDFMPLNLVERVEALGAGKPGHPHITRALARAHGVSISKRAARSTPGKDDLGDWLAIVTQDVSELLQAFAGQNLSSATDELSINARAQIGREAGELIARLEELRSSLDTT